MESYIAVFKNSVTTEFASTKQLSNIKPEYVFFICKKKNVYSYGYGSHDKYIICDNTGKEISLNVGGHSITSFETHGTQRDFMLTWTILHDGIDEKYSLHCDCRWVDNPAYDNEWSDPVKDTITLVSDIRTIGLPIRKAIDELLRSIFRQDAEIESLLHHHFLLRNIDFEKSGIPLIFKPEELPRYHKKYKDVYARMKKDVHRTMYFLRDEHDLRAQAIAQITKGNERIEDKASILSHVYLKEGVSEVDAEQFYACRSVETITLPTSVKSISHTAFNFKQKLSAVYITSPIKANLTINFPYPGIMTYNGFIYVPQELLETYKSNMFWKEVAKNIYAIP